MSVLILILCCLFFASVNAHGFMSDPRQRGALNIRNHITQPIDVDAPIDYECHFPAGDKSTTPGSGFKSVKNAAGHNWTPYEPLSPFYKWRSGVCGDNLYGAQDHLRGGKYYWDAKRVRTYEQGSIVFFESEIITHHNGYYEFYICDIDKCGDDISPRCFREGHCTRLIRAKGPCDSGDHPDCGPIDRNNPGRWYLPCVHKEPAMVGGVSRSMAYVLPPWVVCDHCVIQWYWTAANTCNPPGVAEYFTGPDAPRWRPCRGQGGAIGGWAGSKGTCGGADFPEEYWQCSDVRIVWRGAPPKGGHGSEAQHVPHHEPPPQEPSHHEPHQSDKAGSQAHTGSSTSGISQPSSFASTGSGTFVGARSKDQSGRNAPDEEAGPSEGAGNWEQTSKDSGGSPETTGDEGETSDYDATTHNGEVDTASALGL
eukprot:gb/GEZJ01004393.1/.p1 GENE.gb/GEZJ01004393.1/~~gb/GEZJ01004393.1/.p1  ORF type:complete len:425 (+),score=29.04 gb/GEZJ01004393.1/:1004-2278(+)